MSDLTPTSIGHCPICGDELVIAGGEYYINSKYKCPKGDYIVDPGKWNNIWNEYARTSQDEWGTDAESVRVELLIKELLEQNET